MPFTPATRLPGVGTTLFSVMLQLADPPPDLRLVRFCFAKEDATLERAAQRLCAI